MTKLNLSTLKTIAGGMKSSGGTSVNIYNANTNTNTNGGTTGTGSYSYGSSQS